jgi:hypothetical protein
LNFGLFSTDASLLSESTAPANLQQVGLANGVTRLKDLRRAPAIKLSGDKVLDFTDMEQDLNFDLWFNGGRAPSRKIDATGAVWESNNVIYVSTDRDNKAEWWARVVGVRDLDGDDFWFG